MTWKKGESGNPSGRPKVVKEVRDLARKHGSDAIDRLVELMRDTDKRVAVQACVALLDRGYGRPPQSLDMTVEQAVISAVPLENTPEDTEVWLERHGMQEH